MLFSHHPSSLTVGIFDTSREEWPKKATFIPWLDLSMMAARLKEIKILQTIKTKSFQKETFSFLSFWKIKQNKIPLLSRCTMANIRQCVSHTQTQTHTGHQRVGLLMVGSSTPCPIKILFSSSYSITNDDWNTDKYCFSLSSFHGLSVLFFFTT